MSRGPGFRQATDNWPLVALHAILTPDGRVLTYGSRESGQATGYFYYDVWDPAEGLSGGHVTLQNMTLTDIFCSYAVIMPDSGNILIAGGDNWNGTKVESTGNNRSTIYRLSDSGLSRGDDMKLPRWYATVTPLMNGEFYIQGGKGGVGLCRNAGPQWAFPGTERVPTDGLPFLVSAQFPRARRTNFRVRRQRKHVLRVTRGQRVDELTEGTLTRANSARVSTAAMFGQANPPGRWQ